MATPDGARKAWENLRRAHPIQQFGQSGDSSTYNGACACTHCILQTLVLAKTGHLYSQDEISKIAGYPWPVHNPRRRGMLWYSEIMRVVKHFGLPYAPWAVDSALTTAIWTKFKGYLQDGPVMVAMRYSHYPENRYAVYNGIHADGRPNGYAISNGKTQLTGAETMGHAILFMAYYDDLQRGRWIVDSFDPNHGSPARPEKPPFDRITTKQAQVIINSNRLRGLPLMFLVPTKPFVPR